ncbi:trans-sulfuration enzyme family protein [Methylosinus sporium]|uniref:trans-sulfuration enzyme family protein n=1 Tax=Methylosinus sporium TaxID=428 RepID=UPI00383A1926
MTEPETIAAQTVGRIDPSVGALIPPIHPSTTFERAPDNSFPEGRIYSRPDNPTYAAAAQTLNALEGGAETLLFSSGMAAATAVFLALDPGDHVIAPKVMYWALRGWLADFATRWGLRVDFVDLADATALEAAARPGETRLVWVETPANPMWTISDIAAAAAIAHRAGARLAVDSTAASPVLTRPLSLGADLVVHSATKYLNGHSDVVAGAVVAARRDEFWDRIRMISARNGAVLGPFEAWLLQRGLRTLFLRVRAQSRSAQELAERLATHEAVSEVFYPCLPAFRGHDVAQRQMHGGYGGMLSIRVRGGAAAAIATAAQVKIWKRATSLGGVESLIEHRASVEGPGTPVPDDLLRLSTGIESTSDLFEDLARALDSATTGSAESVSVAAP